ncbi:PREDICTED: uncharacterized protein LOC103322894 [Prunus mume]|uniref:Uncharacterized protein LOC103322894 n=1 Tax=Prunus mume TaxID=102107 RepID=A0ABM0ND76_PRUMU|nr:PREDICTED: uncharacterized protein LOC103322894 [Prunus mume]
MKKSMSVQVCFTFIRVLKVLSPPTPPPVPLLARRFMASNSKGDNDMAKNIFSISPISYGDPCHDLFFHVKSPDNVVGLCLLPPDPSDEEREQQNKATINYLKQLLPVAWSHNSLTTLKLIFNLNSLKSPGEKYFPAAFYAATIWLHHNHPKTLLCNIPSFAGSGSFYLSIARLWDLVEILYGLLLEQGEEDSAAQRLHRDAHYKLLHDRVMEVLAEQLNSDIDKLKQHRLGMELESEDNDKEDGTALLLVSQAAECCTPSSPEQVRATRTVLLFESLGRRLFPPESDQSEEWERLRKEFLEPLTEYSRQRMHLYINDMPCVIKKYLEEVKAGGSIIKSDALLPNDIVSYVKDKDVGEAAEIQWKAMMENIYQGEENKFKNCLAVCNITYAMSAAPTTELAASLGILVSELSEEPAWKGKVITLGPLPDKLPLLHWIQGNDLKSRYDFVVRTCSNSESQGVDFDQVCDLILEVAVNNNLKAEQMIKKVFVFTDSVRFGGCSTSWKTLYEAKRSKFKEQGYGDDAMPHILFWNIWDIAGFMHRVEEPHPGVTLLRGNSKTLIKSFLDNGGEIGRHQILEAAIANKEYQTLSVID